VTSGELSIILERVLNCYSVVFFVEGRVAKVLLRVERLLLPEFFLGAVGVEASRKPAGDFCCSYLLPE
jgi:hypothetical protein